MQAWLGGKSCFPHTNVSNVRRPVAIATFEIYGWKCSSYLILIRRHSACAIACVASVSVWFRSKEIPRKGTFGIDRARNETRAKRWKRGEGEGKEGNACRQTPRFWKPAFACVAWRFWLLSNKGGRGQKNREEIGAGATGFSFSRGFAARAPASTKPPCYAGYSERSAWLARLVEQCWHVSIKGLFHTERSCLVRDTHINFLWLLFILVDKIFYPMQEHFI